MTAKPLIEEFLHEFNWLRECARMLGIRTRISKDALSVRITRQYRNGGMAWFNSAKVFAWSKEDSPCYTASFSRPPGRAPIEAPMGPKAMAEIIFEWMHK